ncbi:MAG: glycoside hydrolase, family 43 [Chloroflexi bacterium]|nr:glycoside hydrolase, family 43 [Chloroflexota bacterium]
MFAKGADGMDLETAETRAQEASLRASAGDALAGGAPAGTAMQACEVPGRRSRPSGNAAREWNLWIIARAVCILMLVLVITPQSNARARGTITYRNPVFRIDYPDPYVLRVGGTYYAYGTTAGWQGLNKLFPVLRSTDLTHWRYVADALTSTPSWGVGDWWAPDVVVRNGTYYLYYVGKSLTLNVHCIGVATAHSPTGPFQDHGSLACGDGKGQGYIDPAPFIDSDGKAYLYLSVDDPYHNVSVLPLTAGMLHAAGPRRELFTLSQPWEHGPSFSTVEGPFMVKHAGIYYLFYSGNDWQHDYAMGYATAKSPLGPFTKYARNPILHGTDSVIGPGGGSIFQDTRGRWWLAYHAWEGGPGYESGGVRNLRIDPVSFHNGVVSVHGPTTKRQAGL